MTKKAIPTRILRIASIASIAVFLSISSVLIVHGSGQIPLDRYVNGCASIRSDHTVDLIVLVTDIGDPIAMGVLTAIFGTFLILRKDRRNAAILMGGMLLVFFLDLSLKLAFQRERPGAGGIPMDSYSYPSGHTFAVTFFFLFMAYLSNVRFSDPKVRWPLISACFAMPLIIGATRILLGVHWLTDVLAGFAIGTFLVSSLVLLSRSIGGWKKKRTIYKR
jgi:undecaprenyl-diphosphatase